MCMQVSGWSGLGALRTANGAGSVVVYNGMVDCFVRTVQEEGFRALFKVRSYIVMICITSLQ
jgi:hypothetical protein